MMTSAQLDRLMRITFGEDWRNKRIVGPLGSFALRDVFDECGLPDPYRPPPTSGLPGVWQFSRPLDYISPPSQAEQLRAMARYVEERYPRDSYQRRFYETPPVLFDELRRWQAEHVRVCDASWPWWSKLAAVAIAAYYAMRR